MNDEVDFLFSVCRFCDGSGGSEGSLSVRVGHASNINIINRLVRLSTSLCRGGRNEKIVQLPVSTGNFPVMNQFNAS